MVAPGAVPGAQNQDSELVFSSKGTEDAMCNQAIRRGAIDCVRQHVSFSKNSYLPVTSGVAEHLRSGSILHGTF